MVTRLPSFNIVDPNPIVGIPRESRYGTCIPFSSTCTPSLTIRSAIRNGVIGRILSKNALYVPRAWFSAWSSIFHSLYSWNKSGPYWVATRPPPIKDANIKYHKICADKFGYFFANADIFFGRPCLFLPTSIFANFSSILRNAALSSVNHRASVNKNCAPPAANHPIPWAAANPVTAAASLAVANLSPLPVAFFFARCAWT